MHRLKTRLDTLSWTLGFAGMMLVIRALRLTTDLRRRLGLGA